MDLRKDSRTRLVVLCIAVGLLVWMVGFSFDRLLARDGVTRTEILLASNGLTAIVAAFLFYSLTFNERLRREYIRERLRTIADMNHHIRNALQVIAYATAAGKDDSVEMIRSSVERIEWALREVLPGHVPLPTESQEQPQEHLRAR
jgi:hypothetical protein